MEGKTRGPSRLEHRDSARTELEDNGAVAASIKHSNRRTTPALDYTAAGSRAFDTARGNGQSRRGAFYPLARRSEVAGLPADEHGLAGPLAGGRFRQQ